MEIKACLRHGQLKQEEWIQLKFKGQDLDRAFELMGVTVRDCICPKCVEAIEQYLVR